MKYRTLIVISICFQSCSHYFNYIRNDNQKLVAQPSHTVTIDDGYDYYIRKVYTKKDTAEGQYLQTNLAIKNSDDNLVEIEYLLISRNKQTAIYLTMMQDKNQKFYETHYLGDSYINTFDFRNFLFATCKADTILFQSKKNINSTEEWALRFNSGRDTVFIENITETKNGEFEQSLPVDRTLATGISFFKLPPPTLVFHDPNDDISENIIPVTNKFFFCDGCKKRRLQIQLQQNADGKNAISFKAKRIPYRADALYDNLK